MGKHVIVENASDVKFLFRRSAARQEELRKLYDRLMERARGRKYQKGAHERHHIVPRSLGGDDSKENIAVLTFEEHFLAHYLLALTTEGARKYGMLHALNQMSWVGETNTGRRPTRRQYSLARKANVEALMMPEHAAATSAGHARRKEEMTSEEWDAWCAEQGNKTAANWARRKAEMTPEEYAAWCKEAFAGRGGSIAAGWARRKAEMTPEEYAAWCKEINGGRRAATTAGWARRKGEMTSEEWDAWCADLGAKISATKLKTSPPVRCLNDGTEYPHAVAAAKVYGVQSGNIHKVCRGECKTTGGLRFEYVERSCA